jgi:thaumarchaeosortase
MVDSTYSTARKHGGLLFLALASLPILATLLLDPSSYTLGWNEGRGGFLAALILFVAEWFKAGGGYRLRYHSVIVASAVAAYFILSAAWLHKVVWVWGESLGVPLLYSWVWVWDYFVYALYLTALVLFSLGRVGLRFFSASVTYLFGFAAILMLDAVLPYDSVAPMQILVPVILGLNYLLLRAANVGYAAVAGNVLSLKTSDGYFTLVVYWPSAGVHSLVIYSLVMLAFLLKVDVNRKVSLFALGVVGTFLANLLRIFLMAVYVSLVGLGGFEGIHSMLGEAALLVWLTVFLLFVSRRAGMH